MHPQEFMWIFDRYQKELRIRAALAGVKLEESAPVYLSDKQLENQFEKMFASSK